MTSTARTISGARARLWLSTGFLGAALGSPLGGEAIDFRRDILPILSENCFECHGPDAGQRKAGLRLDTAEGATRDLGEGVVAFRPGDPDGSAAVARVASEDPDEVMPPPETGKRLDPSAVAALRQWIQDGAAYQRHWAFEPIRDYDPPPPRDPSHSEIDRFIVDALDARGLSLSPRASRLQLIRRATFDLTGLPPRWREAQAFLDDSRPDAFERVIDRLLDSPDYGERWGRHWLDLARYADTHGAAAIGFRRFPFSYTYRDYVIRAFNEDVPYDRFVHEQIAADQMGLPETDPARAALGFLTVGRQFRNRHDALDDQIDVITRGLQGLTVACARCHDHKFDPISAADYYALHAALSNSRPPAELPLVGEPAVPEDYRAELERRKRRRDDILREQGAVMRGRLRMQTGLYLRELAKGAPEQDTSTTFLSYRTDELRPVVLERWRAYLKKRTDEDPVFGPWRRLGKTPAEGFETACQSLVEAMIEENGDPKAFAEEHRFGTPAPKWNPRVLDALKADRPKSYVEVAEAYGRVFAEAHRRWMTAQLEAAIEASPDGTVIGDQDPRHRVANSAIERQLRRHLYAPNTPTALSFDDAWNQKMLNRGVKDSVAGTLDAIHQLNLGETAPPRAMALRELPGKAPQAYVFNRGSPVQRGEPVAPRYLSVLSNASSTEFPDGQRRLGLARAISDPANPLTRRVLVNWVWLHHFGRGLVATPDDFGVRGEAPSHPKLLDYLASRFLDDGWSIKQLHRRIMASAVYQQAAAENPAARERDPDNALLWRMPTLRLEMEAMRDALLAASGALDGPAARGGRPFEETGDQAIARRSVYAFVNRDVISRLASDFDVPNPSSCAMKRVETIVPQQTLFALNSGYIQERAAAMVELPEMRAAESAAERVRRLYRRAYSRDPNSDEIRIALSYIENAPDPRAAWVRFGHALLASNEFHFID